jgi:hypothetical protein
MGEMLRNFGISESGIEGPALYLVLALFACVIVHARLRNRAPGTPAAKLIPFYAGAVILCLAMIWVAFQIENENIRYVIALIYLGLLGLGLHIFGRRYLGVRDQEPGEPPAAPRAKS